MDVTEAGKQTTMNRYGGKAGVHEETETQATEGRVRYAAHQHQDIAHTVTLCPKSSRQGT